MFAVYGGMPDQGDDRTTEPAAGLLELTADGVTNTGELRKNMFGLQGINQIGPTKTKTLQENGFTSIEDVASTTIQRLSSLHGFGQKTSRKVIYSARSLDRGEIYCYSKSRLPDKDRDPIFIDIETDGLSPTMVWLIGVYDSKTDNYMPFLATNPDNKGKAVSGFMSWFSANAQNRPVIAYNGLDYDFPVLYDHINQHCEIDRYLEVWDQAWTFDPLWWGPGCNNAIFPGRTNKLEDVTKQLGWEGNDTGLSGKIVGELFTDWMDPDTDVEELDWEKHKKYCKNDVLSLKYLYEQIHNAEVIGGGSAQSTNIKTRASNSTTDSDDNKTQVTTKSQTNQKSLDNF
jgi:uncharacterized protein YprB with RNaseH-like and TPR domain